MINLLFLFTSSIGFVTVFLLVIRAKNNGFLNNYLILSFFLISVKFLFIGIKDLFFSYYLNPFSLMNNLPALFIITLFYLYFKNIVHLGRRSFIKDIKHFSLFFLLYSVAYLNHNAVLTFSVFYVIAAITLYFLFYLTNSYWLLKNHIWNRKSTVHIVSRQQNIITNWTKFLFACMLLIFIRLIAGVIRSGFDSTLEHSVGLSIIPCVVATVLFIKVLMTPEILYGYDFLINKLKDHNVKEVALQKIWNSTLLTDLSNVQENNLCGIIYSNLDSYIASIEQLGFSDKTFRNANFNLKDLSNLLGIPKSHLQFIFKHHCNLSFSEYKKAIRIKEALNIIDSGYLKSNTIDSLANEVGFSSYSPFFTSFKNFTGVSPKEYYLNKE